MGAAYRKEEGGIYSWMNKVSDHVLPSLVHLCGFPLISLDGEYLRESLGTVLNIPLW